MSQKERILSMEINLFQEDGGAIIVHLEYGVEGVMIIENSRQLEFNDLAFITQTAQHMTEFTKFQRGRRAKLAGKPVETETEETDKEDDDLTH